MYGILSIDNNIVHQEYNLVNIITTKTISQYTNVSNAVYLNVACQIYPVKKKRTSEILDTAKVWGKTK